MNSLLVALLAVITVGILVAVNRLWYGGVQAGAVDVDTIPGSIRYLAARAADEYMRANNASPSAPGLAAAVDAALPPGGRLGPVSWSRGRPVASLAVGALESNVSVCVPVEARHGVEWRWNACVYVRVKLVNGSWATPSTYVAELGYVDDVGDLVHVYAVALDNVAGTYIVNRAGRLYVVVEFLDPSRPARVAVAGRVLLPVEVPPHP